MSGVGSTNAMKKGSANNPFLAYSEADMQGFLNSAYAGCIVKYVGEPISRYLTEQNKTVPEHVKNLVFSPTDGGFWTFFDSGNIRIKIQQKTNGSTKTLYITPGRFYNLAWHFNKNDFTNGNLYLTDSLTSPTEIPIAIQEYFDTEPYWRWNKECVNDQGNLTIWTYDQDVTFTIEQATTEYGIAYDSTHGITIVPYKVNELYKVVYYGGGKYYYEEFCHISDTRTTANSDYIAPGKTAFDFTGNLQTGNGSKINPYLAYTLAEFQSFPVGSFIKWLGPNKTVIDTTTGQMLIHNEVYRAVEDGDILQYVILPTLSNPGTAADLAQGKQLIDGEGKVVEGELEKVTNYLPLFMSDGLEEIPFDALKGCTKLHDYAFYKNTNIKTINVPETVKTFGNRLTEGSTGLTKVNIKSLHAWLESTFGEYGNLVQEAKHLYVNDVPLTHITKNDSDGIINISAYAFRGCTDLVAVELSDSVESIGESIFSICTNLKTFKAKSLKIIPERCFENVSLSSIDVPNVTVIKGPYSMGSSDSFLDMELEFPLVTSVGSSAFYYCAAKSLSFPSLVNAIGDFNFYNNSHLKSINLPLMENMPQVYFLENCTSITKIILPKLITFKLQGISRCNALKTIDLPSVTTITNYSSYCFNYMHNVRLLLRYNGVVTLSTTQLPNAITEIYVPNDQVDNYKADSKWSTYADKIKSLDDFVE